MEPDEGNAGRVFQTGEPEITVDARSDDVAKPAKESYRSAISVPIGEHGVFQAVATEPGEYTEEDVELAELLLSYTAAVVERIQSEQQLRDERDRFGALFEHTSDCIAVLDFEDGDWLVRRVNPSFVETFGYESEEIVGEPIDEYVTPESELEEAREITRRAEDGVATEREVTRRTVNGDREFLLRSVPYRSGGELRGYAVYTDITERKRAERRFRALIERSNDFITVLDPDGTIRYQSPSLERILGHDPERAVGQNVFETIHPEDRDRVREQFMRSIDDPDRTPIMVYRTRHRDGSWRYIESIGSNHLDDPAIEGYVVNSRDVTDRIRRERILETLHESTRELMAAESKAAIADTASDTASDILGLPINGVHLYDAEEGGLVPVAASEAAREMFEEPPTFHPGEGLAWEVYETGEPQFYPDLRDRGDTYNPETPVRSELLVPLGDHGVFIASSTAPDAFDETDVALAKVLAANVETALDRAERGRQLRARTRELERQNQRLDEFASVVAHDLRNPLNVAAGRLHLARERGEASDFEAIERAHDRMSRIIDDVLALARQGRTVGDTTAVGLDEVARAAWANVESGSATLAVEADLTLDADEGRLRTLFENLFRNAIEHGGDAVAVTIGELDGRSGFYLEDDGPGIPPEASERVFESGYSTTPVGTGFGLAIVSSIAEAHGWTITATEAAAGGARFEISGVADA